MRSAWLTKVEDLRRGGLHKRTAATREQAARAKSYSDSSLRASRTCATLHEISHLRPHPRGRTQSYRLHSFSLPEKARSSPPSDSKEEQDLGNA